MPSSPNMSKNHGTIKRLPAFVATGVLAVVFAFASSPLLADVTESEAADLEKSRQRWILLSFIVILLAIVPFYLRLKNRQPPPRK